MQHRNWLEQKYRAIFSYTGLISAIAGITIVSPLIALVAYPEEIELTWFFLIPGLFLIILGLLVWYKCQEPSTSLGVKDGSIVVLLSWLIAIAFGIIPFIIIDGLNLTQAVFESTSGWTTTGLSVINVTQAPHLILLYRSTIQLVGGAGFAILALSAIIAPIGISIATAEGRSEQLVPHIRRSARLVLNIYSGYVTLGIVALKYHDQTINLKIVREVIECTKNNSPSRTRLLNAIANLLEYFDNNDYKSVIKKYKSENKPKPKHKHIPTDTEISYVYHTGFEPSKYCPKNKLYRYPQWQFLYSLLAIYGLRIHEAWNIKNWTESVTIKAGEWIAIALYRKFAFKSRLDEPH